VTSVAATEDSPALPPDASATRRRNRLVRGGGIALIALLVGGAVFVVTRPSEEPPAALEDDDQQDQDGEGFGFGAPPAGPAPVDVEFWAYSSRPIELAQVAVADAAVVLSEGSTVKATGPEVSWEAELAGEDVPLAAAADLCWWVDGGSLVEVDLRTGEERRRVPLDLAGAPFLLVADGVGGTGVWIAAEGPGDSAELVYVDAAGVAGRWSVAGGISHVVADGSRAFARTGRDFGFELWRADATTGELAHLDLRTSTHRALAIGGGVVWVWSLDGLLKVDPDTLEITEDGTDMAGASDIGPDLVWFDDELWMLNVESLQRYNPATGGTDRLGPAPVAVQVAASEGAVWLLAQRWDPVSGERTEVAVEQITQG
jgi:hypothetical protein